MLLDILVGLVLEFLIRILAVLFRYFKATSCRDYFDYFDYNTVLIFIGEFAE